MSVLRKRSTTLIVGSAALAAVLAPTVQASAAPRPTPPAAAPAPVQAQAAQVIVIQGLLALTGGLREVVTKAIETSQNRSGYVKSLLEEAFYKADQRYNVVVMNDSVRHSWDLKGVAFHGLVQGHYGTYRVMVFESGTFTNHGDGGYINWAYRGWFTRDGMTLHFRKP
ncbi:stress protein [Streptomyces sp. A012304]|uniref:stress protein n=1 Tax=Streptomyces sp. A012304 TaxID=375446 RepID=UPI00222E4793|nr:stress protein [Streptomyces sp. A012304]